MKVVIISQGFEPRYMRLQPHRTLLEIGCQLTRFEHEVVFVSDEPAFAGSDVSVRPATNVCPFRIRRVAHTHRRRPWLADVEPSLAKAVEEEHPDIVLWHISLSMILHQNFKNAFAPTVLGVLTSPVTRPADIVQLGIRKASSNKQMIAAQLAGWLAAGTQLRQVVGTARLTGLLTLSETTRRYTVQRGISPDRVLSIAPGVDMEWLQFQMQEDARDALRHEMGIAVEDSAITYFGSPAPIRGTHVLLQAMEQLAAVHPHVKLLLLFRRWEYEWQSEVTRLRSYIESGNLRGRVQIIDGYLSQEQMMRCITCSDLVCLPFEILPSDVPLSVIETMALGQTVVTTDIACIPELVPEGCGFVVRPHAPAALVECIDKIIDRPHLTHICGQCARKYVAQNRTWDEMGKNLVAQLRQMHDKRSGSWQ